MSCDTTSLVLIASLICTYCTVTVSTPMSVFLSSYHCSLFIATALRSSPRGSGRCLLTYAQAFFSLSLPFSVTSSSYPSQIPFLIPFFSFSFFFFLYLCASRGAGRGTGRDLLPLLHAPIPLWGLPLPLLLLLLFLCRSHLLGIPR
jgi:hypothetical protein